MIAPADPVFLDLDDVLLIHEEQLARYGGGAGIRDAGLLTETMSRRHQLSMNSYDRLFPSQDTMPRGGFGNLIALPLQREPRRNGNSIFLDDHLRPYSDDQQWAYLASVPRIDPETADVIAREATRQGAVIGVRLAETVDDEDATPWARLPSRKPKLATITEPLPPKVRAVLAQKLFVEKAGLPSPLINQIKRLAAFQNPEFYKKQSMRLSTATTPRVIACAEDLPQHVGLPRGRRTELEALLHEHGVALDIADERVAGGSLGFRFRGKLTPVQEKAVSALLGHDIGVFVAPPGVGKTDQEPWKAPLPQFIEDLYFTRFGRERPEVVMSIEERARAQHAKKAARNEARRRARQEGGDRPPGGRQ